MAISPALIKIKDIQILVSHFSSVSTSFFIFIDFNEVINAVARRKKTDVHNSHVFGSPS